METFPQANTPKTTEQIEKNKDKLNLTPNINFVSGHIATYKKGLEDLLEITPSAESQSWANTIEFIGTDDIVKPQVLPEDATKLLARMPIALIELSTLSTISYHTFGNPRVIPVPGFDENGNLDQSKIELVPVDEFPREDDHPSRILVGVSNGETIFPTPIPESVSKDAEAVYLYQVHVFLHEFFHTIDYKRRDPELRASVSLEFEGESFTFQEWWKEFEALVLSGEEPNCISSYAKTYEQELNSNTKEKDNKKFTQALAEQICESFVAYQLGIISNEEDWTEFKNESFGNKKQQEKFKKEQAPSANLKWQLMDKLCRAKVMK